MQRKTNNISRRDFLAALAAAAAIPFASSVNSQANDRTGELLVYAGTYTTGTKSEGIYILKLNLESGGLAPYKTVAQIVDPSFIAIDGERRYLYAVNETIEYQGKKSGYLSAFAIDQKSGGLKLLNKQPSLGGAPCHVSISDNNKFVMAANYAGGNVVVLPILGNGMLGAAIDVRQHYGSGPVKDRQEAAHAHSTTLDRRNNFVAACDLGADKVFLYKFDKVSGKLTPNSAQQFFQTKPGAGPRHFAFHPNGRAAFVINELNSSITSLAYDERRGTLKEIQSVSTLPAGWAGANTCADIKVSPDGLFLYGSNRGHDSIVSFAVEQNSGRLSFVEHVSTQGMTPRNFAIDPTGKILLAANQKSDSIVTFFIEKTTGKLRPTGNKADVPAPVCLKLIKSFS